MLSITGCFYENEEKEWKKNLTFMQGGKDVNGSIERKML